MSEQAIVAIVRQAATERKLYSVFVDEKNFCAVLLSKAETFTLADIENFLNAVYRNTLHGKKTFSSVHNSVKFLQEVIREAKGA